MGNTYINAINTGNSWWPWWTWGAWWTRGASLTRIKKKEQLEPGKQQSHSGGTSLVRGYGLVRRSQLLGVTAHPPPMYITGLKIPYFDCHREDWQHCPHQGNGEGVKPPSLGPLFCAHNAGRARWAPLRTQQDLNATWQWQGGKNKSEICETNTEIHYMNYLFGQHKGDSLPQSSTKI